MLKIRLTRTGKTRRPYYRVVVVEHTQAAQGPYIRALGFWDPIKQKLTLNKEELTAWLEKGAQPSDRISRLLKKEGIKHKLISIHERPARGPKKIEPKPEPTEKVSVSENTEVEVEKKEGAAEAKEVKPVESVPEEKPAAPIAEEKPAEEVKAEKPQPTKEEEKADDVESAAKEEQSK